MLFKPLDKDAFAHAVLQIVQTSGLGSVVYDPETFSLKAADREIVIHLGNIFAEHLAAKPWRRSRVLEGFTRHLQGVLAAVEPTADYAKTALRPRVRERTYFEVQRLRDEIAGTQRPEILFRELGGGHLALEVVLDQPDSLRSISVDDLNEWGMTFEDAVLIANDNLLTLGLGRFQSPRPGLFVSAWHDVYDASRLHLAEIVSGLAVKGRPVAMVPNRNSLIITGADDAEGLLAMARLTEEALKQPRPMTGYAFRLDNGWVPFLPPTGHPAFVPLHRLFVQTLAGDYEEQKGLLDALHQKKGIDTFVASVMVMEDRSSKDLSSVATWAEGMDALLPCVNKIAFIGLGSGDEPNILGMADWTQVEAILEDLMEAQWLYPERYRVRAFPMPEQLSRLELV